MRAAVGVGGLERQQHLLRVDHSTAAVGGELQDPRVHANRVLGTRLHAVAAEHALPEIDVEASGHLFDLGVRVLVRDDVDAVRGTDGLAHHAGHAARRAVLAAGFDRGWPETGARGSDSPARTRDARTARGSDSPARTRRPRSARGSDSPARTRHPRSARGSDWPARTQDARSASGSDPPGPAGYA